MSEAIDNFLSLPFSLSFKTDIILLMVLGLVIILTCIKLAITDNLLESVIMLSIFSLLISICYLLLDAPDVAMTETALGACLSTCVLLNLIKIFGQEENSTSKLRIILSAVLCLIFIATLTFACLELPEFGRGDSPLQTHVSKYYIDNNWRDIGIPSVVASILASYRGYDTLGETTVILIA